MLFNYYDHRQTIDIYTIINNYFYKRKSRENNYHTIDATNGEGSVRTKNAERKRHLAERKKQPDVFKTVEPRRLASDDMVGEARISKISANEIMMLNGTFAVKNRIALHARNEDQVSQTSFSSTTLQRSGG